MGQHTRTLFCPAVIRSRLVFLWDMRGLQVDSVSGIAALWRIDYLKLAQVCERVDRQALYRLPCVCAYGFMCRGCVDQPWKLSDDTSTGWRIWFIQDLKTSFRQRDALLKEIYHRFVRCFKGNRSKLADLHSFISYLVSKIHLLLLRLTGITQDISVFAFINTSS